MTTLTQANQATVSQRLAGRPFYTRVALFGALLYLMGVAIFFIAFFIYDPAETPFGLFFLLPGLVVAAALAIIRRWGLLVGAFGGAFGLLILSDGAGLMLSTPYSFFDFTSTLVSITGCSILLVASVLGLIESFRGSARSSARIWELAALRAVAVVLAVVAIASAIATLVNMGSVSAADKAGATVVTAKHTHWDTNIIQATPGEPLKVVVRNDDPILHTFTLHDLGIDLKLGPNSEELIVIEPERAGIYGFICRVTGHGSDMTGAIDIR